MGGLQRRVRPCGGVLGRGAPDRWVLAVAVMMLAWAALPIADAAAEPIHVVALGDSDTSGVGVSARGSYPGQLETFLRERGRDVKIANAGRPGQTAREALGRLDSTVPQGTAIAILQFGTSDIKVNVSPAALRDTLAKMIDQLTVRGVKVVLIGARLPAPQLIARDYDIPGYNAMFSELAKEKKVPYHRFLQGLPPPPQDRERKYYQSDGHLTVAG